MIYASQLETALQNHKLWSCGPFFVEFDGESPRSIFEQEHGTDGRKWPKTLGWRRPGRCYAPGARRQEFEAARWYWIRPGMTGLLWQVACELILADQEHFESLAWLAWLRGGTTDVTNARTCHFFSLSVWSSSRWNSTSDLQHQILRKKSIRSELMTLECSFPLNFWVFTSQLDCHNAHHRLCFQQF